jgi:peroxiredoxin
MSRRNTIAMLCLAGTFLAADLTLSSRPAAGDSATLEGKPAPAVTLQTRNGQSFSLANQKGKVVLIDTWATWCPPCRASLPHIQKLSQDQALADKGLVVWAVNAKEPKNTVDSFMTENQYSFTVLMDQNGDILKNYAIQGIPTTILIGRDGTVKKTFLGYAGDQSAQQIDAAINQALAEPAPR